MKPILFLIGPRIRAEDNIGGATVSFENLVDFFENREEIMLKVFDADFNHLSLFNKLLAYLNLLIEVIKMRKKADYIFLNLSPLNLIFTSFLFSFFIDRNKLVIRFFGTNLDKYLNSIFYIFLLKRSNGIKGIWLQTKEIIKSYEVKVGAKDNLFWLPTSRKEPDFELEPMQIKKDEPLLFIYLGQIKLEKGIFFIKEAIESLSTTHREKVHINVYGPLGQGIYSELFENENISYKGLLKSNDVYQIIYNHHAMIFPSFYEGEGYPGAIIESFLTERPVICSSFKYLPELVNNSNGFLIPPKDADKLREVIVDLIHNPEMIEIRSAYLRSHKGSFSSNFWNLQLLNFFLNDLCCNGSDV